MRHITIAALVFTALASVGSCNHPRIAKDARPTATSQSWGSSTQPAAPLQRLVTDGSEDIRVAMYLDTPGGVRIAAVLRNFELRREGRLDPRRLVLLDEEAASLTELLMPQTPLTIVKSRDQSNWVLCALQSGEIPTPSGIALYQGESVLDGLTPQSPSFGTGRWPVYCGEHYETRALNIQATHVLAGELTCDFDYNTGTVLVMPGMDAIQIDGGWIDSPSNGLSAAWHVLTNTTGMHAVDYSIWKTEEPGANYSSWQEPFPSVPGLLPSLHWVSQDEVVRRTYWPPPKGFPSDATWLERLITCQVSTGDLSVVADHLPAGSHWAVDSGYVFYSIPVLDEEGTILWELWASTPDGLVKRLVWRGSAQRLDVWDAMGGRRLLFSRQYILESGGVRSLRCELLEASLDQQAGRPIRLGIEPLPVVPDANESNAVPGGDAPPRLSDGTAGGEDGGEGTGAPDDPNPPAEGGGNAGDGGEDEGGFIPDEPPGSGPGSPPPIQSP